jgi:hypothetical protein
MRADRAWKEVGVAIATALLTLVGPHPAAAQDDVSPQIWLDYNPRVIWPSAFEVYGDVGVRTELENNGWGRLVVRPAVRGPVGMFRLSGGLGTFFTINDTTSNLLEFRPFQGINWTWPSGRFPLDHYVRLEERLEFETNDWSLDASLRARYRLRTEYRLAGLQNGASWRLIGHVEGFLTVAGNAGQFDEKLRIGLGVERGFVIGIRARLDVTWQKVGALVGGATDDIYIRFRVFQRWLK